jgi:hypothetical protein
MMKRSGKDEEFYKEIESRLSENRRLMEESFLPKRLSMAASYLGFHSFSSMLLLSLLVTVIMYETLHGRLMGVSKAIFLLP